MNKSYLEKKLHQFIDWKLFPFLIILVGAILRLANFQEYPFGFDQVQLLENAQRIVQGDLTLIGPRTGPADMFTGPLIYYLNAFTLIFITSPFSLILSHGIIIIASLVSLYWLSKYSLGKNTAIIIIAMYSFSPYLVDLDRIPWNPSLLVLATSLVFFPLIKVINSKSVSNLDLLFIAAGSFMGYQAHFSGLFLAFLAFLIWVLFLRKHFRIIFAVVIGFIVSLLPTLLFDFRNNWLNTNGLYNLLFVNEYAGSTGAAHRQFHNLFITLENIGKIIFYQNSITLIVYSGLIIALVTAFIFVSKKASTKNLLFSFVWIVAVSILVGLYKGPRPEYYFIVQFLPIILICAEVIKTIAKKNPASAHLVTAVLFPYLLIASIGVVRIDRALSFGTQNLLASEAKNIVKDRKISQIVYDIDVTLTDGLNFLLRDIDNSLQDGSNLHIIHPVSKEALISRKIDDSALWVDIRTDPNRTYISQSEYIFSVPKPIQIVSIPYIDTWYQQNLVYLLLLDNQPLARLIMIDKANQDYLYSQIEQNFRNAKEAGKSLDNSKWISLILQDETFLALQFEERFALLQPLTTLDDYITESLDFYY